MDNLEEKIKEIFSNEGDFNNSSWEQRLELVIAYYEDIIYKLKYEISSKISTPYHTQLVAGEIKETDFLEKIEYMVAEIKFLKEKNDSHELMASNFLVYIGQLNDEIKKLKEMKTDITR